MPTYNFGSPKNPRTYDRQSYGQAVASGGGRGDGGFWNSVSAIRNRQQPKPEFLGGNPHSFVTGLQGAVGAYGRIAGEDVRRQIGETLGGLNAIGGLRSGATQVAVDQAMEGYGRRIGDYASMTARDAYGMAQEEYDREQERAFRERQYQDARRAAKRRGIGGLVGGILGAIPGVGQAVGVVRGLFGKGGGDELTGI